MNRRANVVVAALYTLIIVAGAIGEWGYYIFGSAVEVVLLVSLIRTARAWEDRPTTLANEAATLAGAANTTS